MAVCRFVTRTRPSGVSRRPVPASPSGRNCHGAHHTRSVEQTFGAFADLVRPRSTGAGYEVMPGQLAVLLERLERAPACLEPSRSAGFFAFEQAMAVGLLHTRSL